MTNFNKDLIEQIVFKSIDLINESLVSDKKIPHDSSVQIYGENSFIDSFSFVHLIVQIEEFFFDTKGIEVNLLDAISDVDDNFKNISDLVSLIKSLLDS